jgi:hypothetical protein
MDIAALLATVDIFQALPARTIERLAAGAQSIELAAGDTSNALEAGGAVLFVVDGRVRASTVSGVRIGFADLAAGDAHGLVEATGEAPVAPCALLGLDGSRIVVVAADAFLAAVRSNAASAFALAQRLAGMLATQERANDPLQKVYRDILRAARPVGDSRWTIDPLPKHRDLAAAAGVDEGEAASAIAHLIRLGVARRRYPALDIEDREALRALAG